MRECDHIVGMVYSSGYCAAIRYSDLAREGDTEGLFPYCPQCGLKIEYSEKELRDEGIHCEMKGDNNVLEEEN